MEVYIGTPSYSPELTVDYVRSVVDSAMLLTSSGIRMTHAVMAGCPFLGRARNDIVQGFLDSTATDLLFIDSDVGFDVKVLTRILSYKQEIVGGLVPKRDQHKDDVYHQNGLTGVLQDGLFQSLELPTAFMRIKRSAFDKIAKPYFRAESSEDAYGEDIYFCRKWIAAGEHFYIDSDINFSHCGAHIWRGNFYEHCIKSGLLKKAAA